MLTPAIWGCLGFFLLAMISLSLFPIIKKELAYSPVLQEKVIMGLLTPLAIADVSSLIPCRPRVVCDKSLRGAHGASMWCIDNPVSMIDM